MTQQDRALFHVRGSSPLNTVAVGVKAVAASLNSEDCFVVVTPSEVDGRLSFINIDIDLHLYSLCCSTNTHDYYR